MPISYSTRLKRDLQDWQDRGLIQPEQVENIVAHAFAPRGFKNLQAALVLCILLLVAPSVIAFVAANWSAMSPAARLVVLFQVNAAVVLSTYLATSRHARTGTASTGRLVDGLATLSVVVAAATIALVGQTFHVAADPRGFAGTIALIGTATAIIARSGGAAVVACIALIAADVGLGGLDLATLRGDTVPGGGIWFWIAAPALFIASLSGWLPAREFTLLLLLVVLTNHLGSAPAGLTFLLPPSRILYIAALALALGHILSRLPARGEWSSRFHDGTAALKHAAVGLNVIGIMMVGVRTLGFGAALPTLNAAFSLATIVLAAFVLLHGRSAQKATLPAGDLLVLAAAALALVVWLITGATREPSTFWTVWGGIVPALMLVVAGDLEGRRELYGWGMVLTVGLTIGMLAASRNLIAFSGNLLLCAVLLSLALLTCRWAAHRIAGRLA